MKHYMETHRCKDCGRELVIDITSIGTTHQEIKSVVCVDCSREDGAEVSRLRAHLALYKRGVFEWEKLNAHLAGCGVCASSREPRCSDYRSLEVAVRGWLRAADAGFVLPVECVPCWCGHPKDIHAPILRRGKEGVCQAAGCDCQYFTQAIAAGAGRGGV